MYKTFGSQWFIKHFSSYQILMYFDRKSPRNPARPHTSTVNNKIKKTEHINYDY